MVPATPYNSTGSFLFRSSCAAKNAYVRGQDIKSLDSGREDRLKYFEKHIAELKKSVKQNADKIEKQRETGWWFGRFFSSFLVLFEGWGFSQYFFWICYEPRKRQNKLKWKWKSFATSCCRWKAKNRTKGHEKNFFGHEWLHIQWSWKKVFCHKKIGPFCRTVAEAKNRSRRRSRASLSLCSRRRLTG